MEQDSAPQLVKAKLGSEKSAGPKSCPDGKQTGTASFDFKSPSRFALIQTVQREKNGSLTKYLRISGVIYVKPAAEKLESKLKVDVETSFSDKDLLEATSFESREDSLTIETPNYIENKEDGSSQPCVYILATIWVNEDADLDILKLETQSLSVVIQEGLAIKAKAVTVKTVAGFVKFPKEDFTKTTVNPRNTIVETISGSITGTFPLYDLLAIRTRSGTIIVNIDPKSVLKSDPGPANLQIRSISGSINAETAVLRGGDSSKIPNRNYVSSLTSASGSLFCRIIHGTNTQLSTVSGNIDAKLSPYGDPQKTSIIKHRSTTGTSSVMVLPSVSNPGDALKQFSGEYNTVSGALAIEYPAEWEGTVSGSTVSGAIEVDWPGLKGSTSGLVPKKYQGVKGNGAGKLIFKGVSGSVSLKGTRGESTQEEKKPEEKRQEEKKSEETKPEEKKTKGSGPPAGWPFTGEQWNLPGFMQGFGL